MNVICVQREVLFVKYVKKNPLYSRGNLKLCQGVQNAEIVFIQSVGSPRVLVCDAIGSMKGKKINFKNSLYKNNRLGLF